jgi:hypothetical protein
VQAVAGRPAEAAGVARRTGPASVAGPAAGPRVGSLPVGGAGGLVAAGMEVAKGLQAVAIGRTSSEPGSGAGQAPDLTRTLPHLIPGGGEGVLERGRTTASEFLGEVEGGATTAAGTAAGGLDHAGADEMSRLRTAAKQPIGGLASTTGGATAVSALLGTVASSAVDGFSQMGELIEALEERLLAEIERRGGRFGGVF